MAVSVEQNRESQKGEPHRRRQPFAFVHDERYELINHTLVVTPCRWSCFLTLRLTGRGRDWLYHTNIAARAPVEPIVRLRRAEKCGPARYFSVIRTMTK